ncbi:MAG TPA: N-acetylneuraminate synthase [Desulfuromonadaceae bacterium]|jgi:N-acetylneuraminate synthase
MTVHGRDCVYIIAEAGVNHNGSVSVAKQLIEVAAASGADAVKFQTFIAEKVVSSIAPKADYQKITTDADETQLDMIKRLQLSMHDHIELLEHCTRLGIDFLSTPFDEASVDILVNDLSLARIKVSSGEITNAPLLLKIARYGRPVILSTGMSTLGDVEAALGVLAFGYTEDIATSPPSLSAFKRAFYSKNGQKSLRNMVTLLHCTTEYPAPYIDVNLRNMDTLRSAFCLPVGFSDHTLGIEVAIAAVARGAVIIEKHFTLDRNLQGPDHKASLEPHELVSLISSVRNIEAALGSPVKVPTDSEIHNMEIARKSIVASTNICEGDIFTEQSLTTKRPGSGISPMYYWDHLGKRSNKKYLMDELITP